MYTNIQEKTINNWWEPLKILNHSPYQTSLSHIKRNTNRLKPKSVKKNKRKQQQLNRKINRN